MGLEKTARTVSCKIFEPYVFFQQEMLGAGETGGKLGNIIQFGKNGG